MKSLITILLSLIFNFTQAQTLTGKVIGVKDGDTIEILVDGKPVTIRLHEVDCPEKSQAFGMKAKQFTSDKCFGKTVKVIVADKDRYGRTVGKVILEDGSSLNDILVKNGYAWHYKQYSKSAHLATLELDARSKKVGLWSEPNPTAPWEFRRKPSNTSVTKTSNYTTPTATSSYSASTGDVYICNSTTAKAYHSSKSCSGLNRCTHEIKLVKLSSITGSRSACKKCH